MRDSTCPACGHHVAVGFFDGGMQPLATLAWPSSCEAAQSLTRLPLDFVRCVECGHVHNAQFDYAAVPYSTNPNLMFNASRGWTEHLALVRRKVVERLRPGATVVEIGYGTGHLLQALRDDFPDASYIGFDPHGVDEAPAPGIVLRKELFVPEVHVGSLRPDLIVARHVLEHMDNPLGFLQAIDFAAQGQGVRPSVFLEVPCIDRVLQTGRIADFFYEHNSHFTTESFTRMLRGSAQRVEVVSHGYDAEVVFGIARMGGSATQVRNAAAAADFSAAAIAAKQTIGAQLSALHAEGARVAVWGGTGKAAAFINYFGVDARRFPVVVDSDPAKLGTFVPGTGQEIRSRDHLLHHPCSVILIPTQWRASDIVAEIASCRIECDSILIEHEGRLVDYHRDAHPYAMQPAQPSGAAPRGNSRAATPPAEAHVG